MLSSEVLRVQGLTHVVINVPGEAGERGCCQLWRGISGSPEREMRGPELTTYKNSLGKQRGGKSNPTWQLQTPVGEAGTSILSSLEGIPANSTQAPLLEASGSF